MSLGLEIVSTRLYLLSHRLGIVRPLDPANLPRVAPAAPPEELLRGQPEEHRISVVMPVYNRGSLLDMPIRSLLEQTYTRWQLVAVDDGSTDDSLERLRSWQERDPRISVVARPHRGVSSARNAGLAQAEGELVAFLDSDDRWEPGFLACLYGTWWEQPELHAVYCDHILYDRSRCLGVHSMEYSFARLHRQPVIDLCAVLVERELLDRVGGFDESMTKWVDYELLLRIAHHTRFAHCPYSLLHYYRLEDGITKRLVTPAAMRGNKLAVEASRLRQLRVGLVVDDELRESFPLEALRQSFPVEVAEMLTPEALERWIEENGIVLVHVESSDPQRIRQVVELVERIDRPFTVGGPSTAALREDLLRRTGCRGVFEAASAELMRQGWIETQL